MNKTAEVVTIVTVLVIIVIVVWNLIIDKHFERKSRATVIDIVSVKPLNRSPLYAVTYKRDDGQMFLLITDKVVNVNDRIVYSTSPSGISFKVDGHIN